MNGLRGHEVDAVLREVPGSRRVLRTRLHGVPCVTRVLLAARVGPELGPLVERVAMHGRGSLAGVPEELLLTLEGYRVAARLPQPDPRWPQALAAGVTPEGRVFVTTRWIEGTPLHATALPDDARRATALGVLAVLCELHAHNVVHGDLKPENVVVGPGGDVAIIDLDTLREVGGPDIPAITRDLTRSWAAPEQSERQQTWLASDLWCWARLVDQLYPEGPPPGWAGPLAACRHPDPLRRPHTARLLAHLNDPAEALADWADRPLEEPPPPGPGGSIAGDATERVPEPTGDAVRTERVPDATTSPRAPAPSTPPARRKGPSCGVVALAVVLAPIVLCGGVVGWIDHRNVVEANRQAEETMAALKAHKTTRELNGEAQRERLRALAEEAWNTRRTPRSSAVRALALVWSQGWQDQGRSWNEERWRESMDAIEAVEDSRQPEALLALGTLYGASCRLRRGDAAAMVDCTRALAALAELRERLPDTPDHHWLRVEAAWTEVLVRGELARRQLADGLPEGTAMLDGARARCAEAEAWLPWAPVNGPELLQDCLRMAGLAEDLPSYFREADLLVAADRQDGELTRATLWHLYAAAGPGCDVVTLDRRRGDWVAKGPDWCLATGLAARHCYAGAAAVAARGAVDDPEHPWDALASTFSGGDAACVR